jgi:phosphoglycerate kinase
MALKYVDEIELKGKKVIARFDFNVPLDKEDRSKITDTTRIDEALETIRYILDQGCSKLILMSHLGRPDGEVNKKYSLEPVAAYLAEHLGQEVTLTESCLDRGIKTLLTLNTNNIILLENLRFHKEEEAGDTEFAKALSEYADIYVNDAFGTAHRSMLQHIRSMLISRIELLVVFFSKKKFKLSKRLLKNLRSLLLPSLVVQKFQIRSKLLKDFSSTSTA